MPLLKAWTACPTQGLAVDIVFRDAARRQALETLSLDGAYCVSHPELL